MFENLLSFHQPAWIKSAEHWADEIFHLYQLGLLKGPRYPEEWFAGRWERKAIEIIIDLHKEHGEVTASAFSEALGEATSEVEAAYS